MTTSHGTEKAKGRGKGDRHNNSDNAGSKARASATSSRDGSVDLGAGGEAWSWANLSITLAGGIISQLIEEVEDQLGGVEYQLNNAQECIEWYERERSEYQQRLAKLQRRLESLKALESQLESAEAINSEE